MLNTNPQLKQRKNGNMINYIEPRTKNNAISSKITNDFTRKFLKKKFPPPPPSNISISGNINHTKDNIYRNNFDDIGENIFSTMDIDPSTMEKEEYSNNDNNKPNILESIFSFKFLLFLVILIILIIIFYFVFKLVKIENFISKTINPSIRKMKNYISNRNFYSMNERMNMKNRGGNTTTVTHKPEFKSKSKSEKNNKYIYRHQQQQFMYDRKNNYIPNTYNYMPNTNNLSAIEEEKEENEEKNKEESELENKENKEKNKENKEKNKEESELENKENKENMNSKIYKEMMNEVDNILDN